jgi:hypothetical protein
VELHYWVGAFRHCSIVGLRHHWMEAPLHCWVESALSWGAVGLRRCWIVGLRYWGGAVSRHHCIIGLRHNGGDAARWRRRWTEMPLVGGTVGWRNRCWRRRWVEASLHWGFFFWLFLWNCQKKSPISTPLTHPDRSLAHPSYPVKVLSAEGPIRIGSWFFSSKPL